MGKKLKIANRIEAEKDLEELDAFGFEVEKFSSVHWRITHIDDDFKVDVWPTTKKLMSVMTRKSKKYTHLAHDIEELHKEEIF